MEEYRYRRTSYRCSDCKYSFDKVRKFAVNKYPHGADLPFPAKDPECPQCKGMQRVKFKNSVTDDTHKHINPANEEASFVGGTPEHPKQAFNMGNSNFTKAMDTTAEIVMRDYGLTDLQDNLRAGDSMAPKLQGTDATGIPLEQRVDQVFKPQKPIMGQQTAGGLNRALTGQINAGKFAGQSGARDITARAQNSGYKVPTNILHEFQPERKPN